MPRVLTALAWLLWVASLAVLALRLRRGAGWTVQGLATVDGVTVVVWVAATFLSAVVHSYARRYLAGSRRIDRFFGRVFAFTLVVLALVAADHLLAFVAAWLAMGLLMADLIGHVDDWPQARAAGALARRYFLTGGAALAVGAGTLWWHTGATTVSGVGAAVSAPAPPVVLVAAGALVLAAMVQSALVPFHTWLLSSMTAPTPASALMHAGFVNAGGILLVRFAPVVAVDQGVALAVALVGAVSALAGTLLEAVTPDVKGQLGCSTVGQMGFMILQAGLGFFAAALAHLVLHGFYKAYQFLSSGGRVDREPPGASAPAAGWRPLGLAVSAGTALAGGALFAALTGKGAEGGLLLTSLVVLTVLHAARGAVAHDGAPAAVRYGAVPLVALPAIGIYAAVYRSIAGLLAGLPAIGQPTSPSPAHWLVAVAFLAAYLVTGSGAYRPGARLYAWLTNAARPASGTLLTSTEEYDEH